MYIGLYPIIFHEIYSFQFLQVPLVCRVLPNNDVFCHPRGSAWPLCSRPNPPHRSFVHHWGDFSWGPTHQHSTVKKAGVATN